MKNICSRCPKYKSCFEPCAFVSRLKETAKEICLECPHYSKCRIPCFLADSFINENTKQIFEKPIDNGEIEILVIYTENDRKFKHQTALQYENNQGKTFSPINKISTEDVENFWEGVFYSVKSIKLGIFIDRFFNKMSYADMAVKYDTEEENAKVYYMLAKSEVFEFLEAWNHEKRIYGYRKIAETNINQLNKLSTRVRAFLLHHCFGLAYKEVAEVLGVNHASVQGYIGKLNKDVAAGVPIIKFDNDMKPENVPHMEKARARQKLGVKAEFKVKGA